MPLQTVTDAHYHGEASKNKFAKIDANTAILKGKCLTINGAVTALETTRALGVMPQAGTVTAIKVACNTAPASASGSVALAISGGGNSLLEGTFDLESLSDLTVASATLTSTTANLTLAAGDLIIAEAVSDAGDMTGGAGLVVSVVYQDV